MPNMYILALGTGAESSEERKIRDQIEKCADFDSLYDLLGDKIPTDKTDVDYLPNENDQIKYKNFQNDLKKIEQEKSEAFSNKDLEEFLNQYFPNCQRERTQKMNKFLNEIKLNVGGAGHCEVIKVINNIKNAQNFKDFQQAYNNLKDRFSGYYKDGVPEPIEIKNDKNMFRGPKDSLIFRLRTLVEGQATRKTNIDAENLLLELKNYSGIGKSNAEVEGVTWDQAFEKLVEKKRKFNEMQEKPWEHADEYQGLSEEIEKSKKDTFETIVKKRYEKQTFKDVKAEVIKDVPRLFRNEMMKGEMRDMLPKDILETDSFKYIEGVFRDSGEKKSSGKKNRIAPITGWLSGLLFGYRTNARAKELAESIYGELLKLPEGELLEVNLQGKSRGCVTSIKAMKKLEKMFKKDKEHGNKLRNKLKVNMFLHDPVPGNYGWTVRIGHWLSKISIRFRKLTFHGQSSDMSECSFVKNMKVFFEGQGDRKRFPFASQVPKTSPETKLSFMSHDVERNLADSEAKNFFLSCTRRKETNKAKQVSNESLDEGSLSTRLLYDNKGKKFYAVSYGTKRGESSNDAVEKVCFKFNNMEQLLDNIHLLEKGVAKMSEINDSKKAEKVMKKIIQSVYVSSQKAISDTLNKDLFFSDIITKDNLDKIKKGDENFQRNIIKVATKLYQKNGYLNDEIEKLGIVGEHCKKLKSKGEGQRQH